MIRYFGYDMERDCGIEKMAQEDDMGTWKFSMDGREATIEVEIAAATQTKKLKDKNEKEDEDE